MFGPEVWSVQKFGGPEAETRRCWRILAYSTRAWAALEASHLGGFPGHAPLAALRRARRLARPAAAAEGVPGVDDTSARSSAARSDACAQLRRARDARDATGASKVVEALLASGVRCGSSALDAQEWCLTSAHRSPSLQVWTCLITALGAGGQPRAAEAVLAQMAAEGVRPAPFLPRSTTSRPVPSHYGGAQAALPTR